MATTTAGETSTLTSAFGFTNTTAMTKTIAPTSIQPLTDYALIENTADSVVYSNKTAPLDQVELISYRDKRIPKVNTEAVIQYPALVQTGIQYVIRLDEVLRTTKSDGTILCDEPIVMYLTVRQPLSGNITNSVIGEVMNRLIGALQRNDGSWRFDDLMRSALEPTIN